MLFETISQNHDEKKVISLCKKLTKSCSFTRSADVTNLCELVYLLYVYGDRDNALKVCEHANIKRPTKVNYNIWDFILWIWGLQAHIYGEIGQEEAKNQRIAEMKKVWSTPRTPEQTEEEKWAFHERIAKRLTLEDACRMDKIERALAKDDQKGANAYRFLALYKMIGYGVTGFYPELEKYKEELADKIQDYIAHLRKANNF